MHNTASTPLNNIKIELEKLRLGEGGGNFSAQASKLTWKFDIQERLESLAKQLEGTSTPRHTFASSAARSAWNDLPGFEIVGTSESEYSPTTRWPTRGKEASFAQEEPASLRYEMNPDGSVAVLLTPHSNPLRTLNEKIFLIDWVKSSHAFAGEWGNHRLSLHISAFLRLCDVSHGLTLPSRSSGRYLRKLQRKSDKFRNLYGSYTQKRKAERDADIAIGTGLAGGLVASTLLPLARDAGDNARKRLIHRKCDDQHFMEARCSSEAYAVRDRFISSVFTTESVFLVGLVMFVGVLMFIRRMFK